MPITLPTPKELQGMSWHKRQRIQRAILRIAMEADRVAAAETKQAFGLRVMEEARALERGIRCDSAAIVIERRRIALAGVSPNWGNGVDNSRFHEAAIAIPVRGDMDDMTSDNDLTQHSRTAPTPGEAP